MNRPKTVCRHGGCNALSAGFGGYCEAHKAAYPAVEREPFKQLDRKKTPEQKKFYGSQAWRSTSQNYRAANPLCSRCRDRGIRTKGDMVHHNPPLEKLTERGLNPLDWQYLQTLCNRCHLEDLRAKKCKTLL